MNGKIHETVMKDAAVAALHIKNQAFYIDGTLGTGGHSLAIVKEGGKVLGIDMDPEMIALANARLEEEANKSEFRLVNGNFTNIEEIAKENKWTPVSGILLDLGVSNLHLKDIERGFSFSNPDARLDMRLDTKSQGVTGADLLNVLRRDQLEELFAVTLEGGPARWLATRVIDSREWEKIETVGDFLDICKGLRTGKASLNEATLPFLALRIAVNNELDNLRDVLPKAYNLLEKGGRLVVITFHSGEDKIVKEFMKSSDYVKPDESEIYENPRARSAKMRIMEKA